MKLSEENTLNSCLAIAHYLRQNRDENDKNAENVRGLLIKDLVRRVGYLEPADKAFWALFLWHDLLPNDARLAFANSGLTTDEVRRFVRFRRKKDIGIVTVIAEELEAVLIALGKDRNSLPDVDDPTGRYWFAAIPRNEGRPLSIVVTYVGAPRNVPCAITVSQMLAAFELEMVCMVGIAAGVQAKVKQGDVVWSLAVYDYEHCRLELQKKETGEKVSVRRERPYYQPAARQVVAAVRRLKEEAVRTCFRELALRAGQDTLLNQETAGEEYLSLHDGNIAAGEVLIADGSLQTMYEEVDNLIRAGDEDDSGFSQAASDQEIDWMIFRGISDYGDPDKPKKNEWHFRAALSAAATCLTFLKFHWRPRQAAV